jgi:site-specific recombinase XerD
MKGCRPLNRHERKAVMAHADTREAALFALGVATGFRISELLSLNIGDVVDKQGRALPYVTVKARNTKTKEGRTVPLNSDARKAVEAQAKHLLSEGATRESALFLSRKGKGVAAIGRVQAWRMLKALFDLADVLGNVATHSMRKSFAAEVYRLLGGKIEKVQAALGHRSITSTVAYLSFNMAEVEEAIGAIRV